MTYRTGTDASTLPLSPSTPTSMIHLAALLDSANQGRPFRSAPPILKLRVVDDILRRPALSSLN